MSPKAKALLNLYRHHKITIEGLQHALSDGVITQEEYDIIVGR